MLIDTPVSGRLPWRNFHSTFKPASGELVRAQFGSGLDHSRRMALRRVSPDRDPGIGVFGREADSIDAGGLSDLTDVELMARVGRGDEPSIGEIQRRHRHAIVCYAAAIVDGDTAEDVAQETFLRASTHAARWRPLGPLRTYLLHIARNIALNERRRQRNRSSTMDAAGQTLARRTPPTPGELLDESELRNAIMQALDAMPERRREVFALVRFGGLSYSEAAAVMGTSQQTTANQMSAAMADLRRAIAPFSDEPA